VDLHKSEKTETLPYLLILPKSFLLNLRALRVRPVLFGLLTVLYPRRRFSFGSAVAAVVPAIGK